MNIGVSTPVSIIKTIMQKALLMIVLPYLLYYHRSINPVRMENAKVRIYSGVLGISIDLLELPD
jgi:hypothetical protein